MVCNRRFRRDHFVQPLNTGLSAKEYLNSAFQAHAIGLFLARDLDPKPHLAYRTGERFADEIRAFHNVMLSPWSSPLLLPVPFIQEQEEFPQ